MPPTEASLPDAEILAAAMELAPEARGRIAAALLRSLDDLPPGQRRTPEEWDAEINRRVDSALEGDSDGVQYDEAIAAIRAAGRGE